MTVPSNTTRSTRRVTVAQTTKRRSRWKVHLGLTLVILVMGFPVAYAILLSTQDNTDLFNYRLTPGSSLVDNLRVVMVERRFATFMLNSVIQAAVITVGKTILSLLAGLAFVYFRFRGKWIVFGFVLITLMMPIDIMVLALFRMMSSLGWGDSLKAITVPFLASATGAFLFRQHFSSIPAELSEAAKIDGATPLQFLWKVLIPMSWNVIGALAVIEVVYVWNMYLWPLLILREQSNQVVQVGLSSFINTDLGIGYGPMMAATIIATVPPLLVFVALQKRFMSGFQLSVEK